MTDILQKSENVAKNVANKNSQDLTEQWKKGELPEGWYFVILNNGKVDIAKCSNLFINCGRKLKRNFAIDNVAEVIEPICYEKWQAVNQNMDSVMQTNQALCQKLTQLKEQINKCYLDAINRGTANTVKAVKEFGMPERIKELVEQNAQFKELLRIILSKTEICYSMVFQKDIINVELNEALLKKIDEALK